MSKLWLNKWCYSGKTVVSITFADNKPNDFATPHDRVPSMMDNVSINEPVVFGGNSEGKVIFQCVTTR